MYSEGENRYLKDLDCVNIVKTIRELKALSRIILNKYQVQLLAFERDSVLPSNKENELRELNCLHNQLVFENDRSIKNDEYSDKVGKFIEEFTTTSLSELDTKIIDEITCEDLNQKSEKILASRHTLITPIVKTRIKINQNKVSLLHVTFL